MQWAVVSEMKTRAQELDARFASVWCSALQCVAACCNLSQGVAGCCMCGSVLQCERGFVCVSLMGPTALQCVAVCCSVLQCVAVCGSVLQCAAACKDTTHAAMWIVHGNVWQCVAV